MGLQDDQVVTGYQSGSPRQRLISTLLSAAIVLLALLFAIYQTEVVPRLQKKPVNPTTFDVQPSRSGAGAKATEKHTRAPKSKAPRAPQHQTPVEVPVPTPTTTPTTTKPAFTFLKMSHADMAAADIGAMGHSGSGDNSAGKGSSGATYGPGEGPGGMTLYNADWYRRPTDAQLGTYLPPHRPPSGWGEVACQTIDHYHVENCEILAESPRGSGFGRAVLNAAWQFEVIPPRVNGKAQIGSWVRIRIDYSQRELDDQPGPMPGQGQGD